MVTARFTTLGAAAVWLLVSAGPATAFQAEVARYYASIVDICRTGVTPKIAAAYEQARQAVERARYGGGRDNNFSGVKTPEGFWLDCLQGSDGKT